MTQTQNHLPWVPRAQSGQGRSSQALTRAPNPAACVHPGLTSRPASPPGTPPGSQAPLPPFFPLQAPMRGSWLVTPTVLGGQEGTGSPTVLTASQHVGDPGPARSCPCSDPPPTSSLPPPSKAGTGWPPDWTRLWVCSAPPPSQESDPRNTLRTQVLSLALGRGPEEGQRDRETEGWGPILPVQSEPVSNHAPQRHCHHPRTRSAHKTPGGTAPAPCSPLPSLAVPTFHVALLGKLQRGHPRCQKQTEQAGGALPPAPSPAVPGGSHGPSQPGPPRKAGAQGYLAEGCKLQPEAQLGHGGRRVPRKRWEQLPHDHGRLSPPALSPQPARPHLHVGLVTACAYFP